MQDHKIKIHEILFSYLKEYIPVQEITHASNEICKAVGEDGSYSEATILDMHTYLQQADKEFTSLQTVNTKSLTNNNIILAIHDIRKYLQDYEESYVPPVKP